MKTVAVIFGGRSAEHDISIVTAIASIIKPLLLSGLYKVEPIYISKEGVWYWDQSLANIELYRNSKIDTFLKKLDPVQIQLDGGLTLVKSSGFTGRKLCKIDVVFSAMHGTFGEDGSLMGLLNMAGVPYVGCDMSSSVLAMDKVLAKQIAASNDVPVVPYVYSVKTTFERDPGAIIADAESRLSYPLFIKPAHLGSSIGISRATNIDELRNAIELAFHYDDKIVIEEEVKNLIEVTLPIIGNQTLQPALLERPLTDTEDFFDFETKYMQGGKKGGGKKGATKGAQGYSELPAKLPKELYKTAEKTALSTYRALGCQGIARVDLLIDSKANTVYFNEANPLPGSLYAHNWRASGVSSVDLVKRLIDLAFERHATVQKQATAFSTNFLQQF